MTYSTNRSGYRTVFLFTGQGSHYRGMGEKLFKTDPIFAQALCASDALIQDRLGRPLIKELYFERRPLFNDLVITHPAIVSVELALWSLLSAAGVRPDLVVGSSLGEFSAAAVCGVWTPDCAVKAAIAQAESITKHDQRGGMLAVIDIKSAVLTELILHYELHIASNNFPGHYTVSGSVLNLNALEVALKVMEIIHFRLPVDYAFHSPLLSSGKTGFMNYMRTAAPLHAPCFEYISGLNGQVMTSLSHDYFWDVVSQTADFSKLVLALEQRGPCLYVDLGPSGTAATFVKNNLPPSSSSIVHQIMTPFKQEEKQLLKLFEILENQLTS